LRKPVCGLGVRRLLPHYVSLCAFPFFRVSNPFPTLQQCGTYFSGTRYVRGSYTRCSFFRSITNSTTSTPNTIAATASEARKVSNDTPSLACAVPLLSSGLKVETDDVLFVVEAVEDTEIEVADPDEPVIESALDNADEKAVETAEEKTSPEDRAVAVAVFVVDMEGYPRRSGANDHGSFVRSRCGRHDRRSFSK
jgi:hypothetical protein